MKPSDEPHSPPPRNYRGLGGHPPLEVDFVAVCDADLMAWNGSGQSVTNICLLPRPNERARPYPGPGLEISGAGECPPWP